MRTLFTAPPAIGHFHPLVPLAEAARKAGHDVAFAMPPAFAATVERLGFRHLAAGSDRSSPEWARLVDERDRLPGRERAAFMQRHGFAGVLARAMTSDVLEVCASWQPDILVRDAFEFGGCVAAEALGIPHAALQSVAFRTSIRANVAEPLAELRAAHRLSPDSELRMLDRYLVLSPFPPSLDAPANVLPRTLCRYRATPFDRSGDEDAPDWPLPLAGAPLIYATLGTVNNRRTDILRQFVGALRDERVNLVVTVGRDGDPDQFGPRPSNVRIERYVPQSLFFPRCDLVICHGGSGTLLAALASGIPLVLTPIAADQPENAARAAAAGAARVVNVADVSAASVREAALGVLADPGYRRAAERIRDEIDAMLNLDHVTALLERLAAERRPLIG